MVNKILSKNIESLLKGRKDVILLDSFRHKNYKIFENILNFKNRKSHNLGLEDGNLQRIDYIIAPKIKDYSTNALNFWLNSLVEELPCFKIYQKFENSGSIGSGRYFKVLAHYRLGTLVRNESIFKFKRKEIHTNSWLLHCLNETLAKEIETPTPLLKKECVLYENSRLCHNNEEDLTALTVINVFLNKEQYKKLGFNITLHLSNLGAVVQLEEMLEFMNEKQRIKFCAEIRDIAKKEEYNAIYWGLKGGNEEINDAPGHVEGRKLINSLLPGP